MTTLAFPRIALPALAAAVAVVGFQAAAFASPPAARNASVSYAGLDLSTAEGQRALDGRIERAVREVCVANGVRDLASRQRQAACESETRAAVTVVRDQLVANAKASSIRQASAVSRSPAVN